MIHGEHKVASQLSPKCFGENGRNESIKLSCRFRLQSLQGIRLFLYIFEISNNPALLRQRRSPEGEFSQGANIEMWRGRPFAEPSNLVLLNQWGKKLIQEEFWQHA